MKKVLVVMAVLLMGLAAAQVSAAPGDSWILPINHRDGGGWTICQGGGYGGSDAWTGSGPDGVRRVYWSLADAPGISPLTKLYSIQFWAPVCTEVHGDWQPIESQFKGVDGETFPIEPEIPWAGAYGTNHEYIGSEFGASQQGTWVTTGPGPHTPEFPYGYNAGANGIQMWLKGTSWLYAKWDYGWSITRCWDSIKITECPEPSSLLALLAGVPALLIIRRKR